MTLSRSAVRIGLGLALLVCLGITLAFDFTVGYAADESSHLHMVEHHSKSLDYASWEDWTEGSYRAHAYHLFSPLPYLVYVPFHWIQQRTDVPRNRITRLGGCVYAVAQFWVTWLLVSQLLGRTGTALLATLAANLIPELRHLHGYVNADSFAILTGTFAFYLIFRMRDGERMRLSLTAWVGLSLAGLAHAKPTAYPIAGVLLAVFAWRLRSYDYSRRELLRRIGIAVCIPIALALPFHLHVYRELGTGEWMAAATHLDLSTTTNHGLIDRRPLDLGKQLQFHWSRAYTIWMTTWGWVPWHAEIPSWILTQVSRLGILGVLGAVVAPRALAPLVVRRSLLLALPPLTLVFTLVVLIFQSGLQIQGRLLLPAGVAALVFLILGGAALLRRLSGISPEHSIAAVSILWIALLAWGNLRLLVPDERFQETGSASRALESHAVVREDLSPPLDAVRPLEHEAFAFEEGTRDVARLDVEGANAPNVGLLQ